jgi:predicted solute-binding protein
MINKHIALFVNDFTLDIGSKGQEAVNYMFEKAIGYGFVRNRPSNLFIL